MKDKLTAMIKESLYVAFIKRNRNMILISALLSVLLVAVTYPGIMYSDSYRRAELIDSLELWFHAFWSGQRDLTTGSVWWTLTPIYFLWLSVKLTGSIALYTYFQSFFFLMVMFVFGNRLISNRKILMAFYILATPVFAGYSIYQEASVVCAAAVMAILMLIWKWNEFQSRTDKVVTLILLLFLSFLTFGYRANAFTILPALLAAVFIKQRKRILEGGAITAVIFAGFLMVSAIPKALHINTMSSYIGGFIWEIISVIQTMEEEDQQEYMGYLDDIFGEGITAAAVEQSTYKEYHSDINSIWWGNPFDINEISRKENTRAVLKKYVLLIKEEPGAFFKTKGAFAARSMGINMPLRFVAYPHNEWDYMPEYDFNDSRVREDFVEYFNSYMEFMCVFRRPWIMFAAAFLLILIRRGKYALNRKEVTLQEISFLTALFYYGAYLLDTQSFEFRYFFPSWVLLFFVIVSLVIEICDRINRKTLPVILLAVWTLVTLGGGYAEFTEHGDDIVETIKSEGILLAQADRQAVYYLDDNLYFLAAPGADTEFTYFLHYYKEDGTMTGHDFRFRDRQLYTSAFHEKAAVSEVPLQGFSYIEFGQCYGDIRFWEQKKGISEFVAAPQWIDILDFSDENWTHGYSNWGGCLLASNVSLENTVLVGKRLILPDGRSTVITDTEVVEGYQRIYTQDDISAYGERSYQIGE